MDWKPIGDKILVRKLEDETETTSGLILVNDQRTIKTAEVVSVGSGTYRGGNLIPPDVSVGDTVYFHKEYGTDLPDGDHMILHEEDILGKISAE